MTRVTWGVASLPALALLAGCVATAPPPTPTQIVVQQPPSQVMLAPGPPPPPNAELVPPPPQGAGPVVWQPGHWRYTGIAGAQWAWVQGQYMPPPPGMSILAPRPMDAVPQRRLAMGRRPLGLIPPSRPLVIPAPLLVIPAKAGTQSHNSKPRGPALDAYCAGTAWPSGSRSRLAIGVRSMNCISAAPRMVIAAPMNSATTNEPVVSTTNPVAIGDTVPPI